MATKFLKQDVSHHHHDGSVLGVSTGEAQWQEKYHLVMLTTTPGYLNHMQESAYYRWQLVCDVARLARRIWKKSSIKIEAWLGSLNIVLCKLNIGIP